MTNTSIDASAIPAGWEAVRMDKHLHFTKHQVTPDQMADQEVFHYSIPQVQETGVGALEDGSTIDSNKLIIDRDKLLVSRLNPRKATICLASPQKQLTVCSTEFVPVSPTGIDLRFVQYITLSDNYRQRLESLVESATRSHQRVAPSDIYKFWWAIPPREIQGEIVDFLDRETAKIDALIDKQEQLIATLREDRAATITHAVTRGLDPEASMKDSGHEAIGCIPEGWSTQRLKTLLVEPLTYGANAAADDDTPDNPRYVRITDIDADGRLREETFRSLPPEVAAPYLLKEGDLLFARSGATVGKTFLYKSSWGICCYAGYLIRARVNQTKMVSAYLKYFTDATPYWHHIVSEQIQATIQNVSADRYSELIVTVPPLSVQQDIIDYLDNRCSRIGALIEKSTEMIEMLREHRSALITNAVTGKIDVREVA